MAEVIGTLASAMTLAGAFKVCIEGFDLIKTALNHDAEVKKLTLKLKVERCRLLVWGQAMGLVTTSTTTTKTPMDDCPYADTIREILEYLAELFRNSDNLVEKYGCRELLRCEFERLQADSASPSERLSAAFDKSKSGIRKGLGRARNITCWAVQDQAKFVALIADAKDFIDGLQDITKDLVSTSQQEDDFNKKIGTIGDPETLQMIHEVCESDHPSFSDTASVRAEAISRAATDPQDVLEWVQNTPEPTSSNAAYKVDDWDKTELKQRYLDLIKTQEQPVLSLGSILQNVREKAPWKAPEGYAYYCGFTGCQIEAWPMLGSFMDHMYEKHLGHDFEADQHLQLKVNTPEAFRSHTVNGQQPVQDYFGRQPKPASWIRPPRILMVEDDPTCRRIGGKFLTGFDCLTETALDGLEAVNKMRDRCGQEPYDLILMDIIMPNLDGVSAAHLIRQYDKTTIVASTSCIRSDDVEMYLRHGMNDVLPKPFTREALLAMLQKHLPHLMVADSVPTT